MKKKERKIFEDEIVLKMTVQQRRQHQ